MNIHQRNLNCTINKINNESGECYATFVLNKYKTRQIKIEETFKSTGCACKSKGSL